MATSADEPLSDLETAATDEDEDGCMIEEEKVPRASLTKRMRLPRQRKPEGDESDEEDDLKPGSIFGQHDIHDEGDLLESDDEEFRNRIGRVPLWWYRDMDHIGYDVDGKRVAKTLPSNEVDRFLAANDPDAWRTVVDEVNQRTVRLTDADIDMIRRLRRGEVPIPGYDWMGPASRAEFIENDAEWRLHPSSGKHPPKAGFLPSKHEAKRIDRLVKLIRAGKLNRHNPPPPETFDLWGASITEPGDTQARGRNRGLRPLPAPKVPLPGHAESFNPPEEYLMTDEEKTAWVDLHPDDRRLDFIPHKFDSFRRVGSFKDFIKYRFERCLDLYLCPRSARERLQIDPEELLPVLPDKSSLRPFPTHIRLVYRDGGGISPAARAASVTPCGRYFAVGCSDSSVTVFDVPTTRPVVTMRGEFLEDGDNKDIGRRPGGISSIQWHPILPLLAVGTTAGNMHLVPSDLPTGKTTAYVSNYHLAPKARLTDDAGEEEVKSAFEAAEGLLFRPAPSPTDPPRSSPMLPSTWDDKDQVEREMEDENADTGVNDPLDPQRAMKIAHRGAVQWINFHPKGAFVAAVCPRAAMPSAQCEIHGLVKQRSLLPFKTIKGGKLCGVAFHPTQPRILLASEKTIRVYDISTPKTPGDGQTKTANILQKFTGIDRATAMAVHPSGAHAVLGAASGKVAWFDFDLGGRPYKLFEANSGGFAVADLVFHRRLPLLAASNGDGSVRIFHAKAYDDLLTNALIIPVATLKAEGASTPPAIQWHPRHAWLFTAHADGAAYMWA